MKTHAPKAMVMAALALVATLAACERKPAAAPQASAPSAKPAAALVRPLAFDQSDAVAKVALRLPAELSQFPALHTQLYDRESGALKDFAAKAEIDHQASNGQFPWRQYNRQTQWFLSAAAPPLLSLRALWFEDTGGAHPNHGGASLLWDTAAGREIQPRALFRADADLSALDKAICDAVGTAKTHRQFAMPLSDTFACPKWSETALVLAPSTQPGKIGGLTAVIDPYVVGPYSEGDYEVTVPLSAFQGLLAPDYAGAFAGAPKSPGHPDGTLSVAMDAVK